MPETIISSEVDYDSEGKQHGFLRIPHSVHRSAYGWIPVPIVVIRNGEGPTTLLLAGNHGDEYEGQIALTKLCSELDAKDIRGRLIILTMANYPAASAGTRTSPIDGGNLNRIFPGNALGTPTQMIAHYIEEVLLPKCDFMFDFHSGGSSLIYPATLLRGLGQTPQEQKTLLELQQAFDAPFAWVFTSGGGPNTTARTAMGAAGRKGVISIMAELGGGGTLSRSILALTERGIKRLLQAIGMLPDYQPNAPNGTRELKVIGSLSSYDSGLFEPYLEPGEEVKKGDEVGAIHHPDEPWREPAIIYASHTGIILCKRFQSQVERGDYLYQIATDLKEAE